MRRLHEPRELSRWLVLLGVILARDRPVFLAGAAHRAGGAPGAVGGPAVTTRRDRPGSPHPPRRQRPRVSRRRRPGREIAESIGPGLAKAAVAIRVDGTVRDLIVPDPGGRPDRDPHRAGPRRARRAAPLGGAHPGHGGARDLSRRRASGSARRSTTGFYYDFEVPRPFTPEDLEADRGADGRGDEGRTTPSCARRWTAPTANRRFADDPLKLERISELGDDEVISIYTDGPFTDLCRGPHVPSTGRLKHFKLLNTAPAPTGGAIRRRQMLQRIYGTAFFKKDELEAHLHRLEEARKRDHRRLGKELDLFMFHPFAPGAAVLDRPRHDAVQPAQRLHARAAARAATRRSRRRCSTTRGSGRSPGTGASTGRTCSWCSTTRPGEHDFSLKPMNCPSHYLMYSAKKHSYRELPIRYTTYDVLHRNEVSGALSGLTRVRQFQQDDCHIFLMRRRRSPDEVQAAHAVHPGVLRDLRAHGHAQVRHPARSSGSATTRCGTRAEGALRAGARGDRAAVRAQAGRRRVLRPQDRLRRGRLDRAEVAAGHDPARLRRARSGSTSSTSARTTTSTGRW